MPYKQNSHQPLRLLYSVKPHLFSASSDTTTEVVGTSEPVGSGSVVGNFPYDAMGTTSPSLKYVGTGQPTGEACSVDPELVGCGVLAVMVVVLLSGYLIPSIRARGMKKKNSERIFSEHK